MLDEPTTSPDTQTDAQDRPERFQVLITDRPWPDCDIEREILADLADVVEAPDDTEAALCEMAATADVIGTCWAPVTEAVIKAAPQCRLVVRFGIGLDNIAVATATERGIPVTNNPDYCVSEVADHTLALLLGWVRKIAFYDRQLKSGEYLLQSGWEMPRLEGRTLGLLGFGRTARAVARRAVAFGLDVIAHSRSGNPHGTGCPMVSFERLLAESDVLSLHVPLSDETHHILNAAAFQQLKSQCLLINTARGGLIDHEAMWHAIQAGQLAGAALDVFDPEPPDLTHPMFQDARILATPHAAFLSTESVVDLRTRSAQQIRDWLEGRRPQNIVNPEVLTD